MRKIYNRKVAKRRDNVPVVTEELSLSDALGVGQQDFSEAIEGDMEQQGYAPVPVLTEEQAMGMMAAEDDDIIEETVEEEIPLEMTDEEMPEFSSNQEAMNYAIDNNEVVRINYVCQGGGRGRGRKLKREEGLARGATITRIVEPHHLFTAGTGNLIVVTFDRSVRQIRAFIVDNIINYIFTGKKFRKRMRIIPESNENNKREMAMENSVFANLKGIGDTLEKEGLQKSAEIITTSMQKLYEMKVSQYVGAQGYWIRNRRCWDNCYRQKRSSEPKTPAQEVWMSCWDEYQKSINNDASGWEKYASEEKNIKEADIKQIEKERKRFVDIIKKKVAEGKGVGESVYGTFKEESQKQAEINIDNASEILDLSKLLNDNGYEEISGKLANISLQILKEADFREADGGQEPGFFPNTLKEEDKV